MVLSAKVTEMRKPPPPPISLDSLEKALKSMTKINVYSKMDAISKITTYMLQAMDNNGIQLKDICRI